MSLILLVPSPRHLIKYWKIHEQIHIELQNDVNIHLITKHSAPLLNHWDYDVSAIPSCLSTATQTDNSKFLSHNQLPVCSSHPPINVSGFLGHESRGSCFPASVVPRWAAGFSPTCSGSHCLEPLQDSSEPTSSSLDPLEIVLMSWNISEED